MKLTRWLSNARLLPFSCRQFSVKTNKPSIVDEYFEVKKNHSDSIVLYQIGDFYEAFGEDAHTLSQLADIQLCKSDRQGFPMTGVPVRSLDLYAERVLKRGTSLAIYDQLGIGENGKILRKFTKLITPGSFWDEQQSNENTKFILAISTATGLPGNGQLAEGHSYDHQFSLAWGEFSTGKLNWTLCNFNNLFRMFGIISPVEIILDKRIEFLKETIDSYFQQTIPLHCYEKDDKIQTTKGITQNVDCNSDAYFDFDKSSVDLMMSYLKDKNISNSSVFEDLKYFDQKSILLLDNSCIEALELLRCNKRGDKDSSLFATLNKTVTAEGSRLLHQRLKFPSLLQDEIEFRLNIIDSFKSLDSFLLDQLRQILKGIPDSERHLQRILLNKPIGTLQSMKKIQIMLQNCRDLFKLIGEKENHFDKKVYCFLRNGYFDYSHLLNSISNSLVDDPPSRLDEEVSFIKEGFSEELDKLRNEFENTLSNLQLLQLKYRKECDNFSLKIISDKKTIGWFIESNLPIKNEKFRLESSNLKYHRYRCEELDAAYKRNESLSLVIYEKQIEILERVRELLLSNSRQIKILSAIVAEIDLAISMTFFPSYTRPIFLPQRENENENEEGKNKRGGVKKENSIQVWIKDGFHPVVADKHSNQLKNFVTNDFSLSSNDFWLITGPNMGGKSTFLRQIAIISIMAQAGLPVPASYARIKLYDNIFCRIGASDDITKNQSTFMVEMNEMAEIFKRASPNSLILLDEVGRGTSYSDGISITLAICRHLIEETKAVVLFATHYHELEKHLPKQVKQYKSHAFIDGNGQLVFSYKIVTGHSNESFGIEVAALAGFPSAVIDQAKQYKRNLFFNK